MDKAITGGETTPVNRKASVVIQEHGKELLIYDLNANKAFCLNETSAAIWQICDGRNSVSAIAEEISRQFNLTINADFVWLALDQLRKNNLLENSADVVIDFGGLSRREVIRKIGLATMAALPLILSLIAPSPTHASSGFCAAGACRCPNTTTTNCPGSTTPTTVNCNTVGGTATCDCVGPYGAPDSAGTGFKIGFGCRTTA
jgi:hypothetical protein